MEHTYDHEQRFYNDTTTWLAEVVDGSMRTSFEYMFDGNELYSRDGGALKPVFKNAIIDAQRLASKNPNLAFERRRRDIEMEEYKDMLRMAAGELPNTMVVVSDFPPELANATKDIGGYNATRKQTMLRVITKRPDGMISISSQSLDGSDRTALESIYGYFGVQVEPGELLGQRLYYDLPAEEQEFLPDMLTNAYDQSLTTRYGGEWYAGRQPVDRRNTYDFVRAQHDLLETFMQQERVLPGSAEGLRYGLAAAIETRFTKRLQPQFTLHATENPLGALQEMHHMGILAQAEGRVFSGCGLSIQEFQKGENQLQELGYGNKTSESTEYNFDKEMHCVVCQPSPKKDEKKKMCGPCGICKGCDTKLRKKTGQVV